MFTGLVSSAQIEQLISLEGGWRLGVRFPVEFPACQLGDSIAIDGACLSVVEITEGLHYFFVSPETIDKTIIRHYRPGQRVNVELTLRPTDRLGGHYVLGHVDGVGLITQVQKGEASWIVEVELPKHLSKYVVYKGSIALNGVSLTVNSVEENRIRLCIIPVTLDKTTISQWETGQEVNLEMDILAKYTLKLLPVHGDPV